MTALAAQISAALTEAVSAKEAATVITKAAVDVLPGVRCASICAGSSPDAFDSIAATDPLAAEADRLQQQLSEGPSSYTLTTATAVSASDIATDERWPLYGPKVAASGLAAQVVLPLQTSTTRRRAVLNLYAITPSGLDRVGLAGDLFASHAAVAWCGAVSLHDVGGALERRKLIGQALGILMERYDVGEAAAFAFLTRASQTANVKLREVAAQVVSAAAERRPTST